MTNVIHATGALQKFILARERGAPQAELKALAAAALAERKNDPVRSRARAEPRGVVVDLDLAHVKLERSWESAPD